MTADELRRRRERLRLTQQELADRLGVHRVTVNRWENGALAIDRPEMVELALGAIEREILSDPGRRAEYNRRVAAAGEANAASATDREKALAEWWWRRPAPMPDPDPDPDPEPES